MARHADRFAGDRRMRDPLAALGRAAPERLAAHRGHGAAFRASL
jgi:hypothetical protein